MKFYGIELADDTVITNLVVERGTSNPTGLNTTHKGRLFFNTSTLSLDVWNGSAWVTVTNTASVTSFNGRTGAVTLTTSDVDGVIGTVTLPTASATVKGAIKVGSGLSIDGNGVLSAGGGAGDMPALTRVVFAQAAAPTGWTQVSINDRMLRVVNTTGGGTGGTDSPTVMNKVPSHTHHFSGTTANNGTHSHSPTNFYGITTWTPYDGELDGSYKAGGGWERNHVSNPTLSNNGDHTHTYSGNTAANGGADTWNPKYIDVIICYKN